MIIDTTKGEILTPEKAGELGARLAKALGFKRTTRVLLEFSLDRPLRYEVDGYCEDSAELGECITAMGDEFARYYGGKQPEGSK